MRFVMNDGIEFKNAIDNISELISEANIIANPEGISITAMDTANVAMVILKMPKDAFENYTCEAASNYGVNLKTLKQLLSRGTKKLMIDLDKQLSISSENKNFTTPLLDLESKDQKVPDLKFECEAKLKTEDLKKALQDIKIVADSVTLTAEGEKLSAYGDGDLAKANVELGKCTGAGKGKYSLDYLEKMTPKIDNVTINFSKNYPMMIKYAGKYSLTYILAPRIDNI